MHHTGGVSRFALAFLAWSVWAQSSDPIPYAIGAPTLQEIWVDPVWGNDANSGATRALALRTVSSAWSRIPIRTPLVNTGYRIQLVAGTYSADDVPQYWEGRWGTYQNPIILQAADEPGSAILPGLNIYDTRFLYLLGFHVRTSGAEAVHLEKCDHILLRNMQLEGAGELPQETFKGNQSQFVYIEDSDISGAQENAIDMVAVQYGHILNNRLHQAGDWCMYLKGGSAQFRIEGNEIFNCGTGGFTAGQGSGFEFMTAPWLHYEAYDLKFVNNRIHDTEGAGMGVNGGYNILLAANTMTRVGSRSHAVEVVFGGRTCDGNTAACASRNAAGGWGTTGGDEPIPNRNIFIYNNLVYNPPGFRSQWQHLSIQGPRTPSAASHIPSPARTDTNLQIRGNVFWNGPADLPVGIEGSSLACASFNTTCNLSQLLASNAFNTRQPDLTQPSPIAVPIPDFPGGDLPSAQTPIGNLRNTVIPRLAADGGGPSVAPRILFFAQALGQPAPPPATLTVTSPSSFQTSINDTPWLSVESSTSTVQVSINSSGLALGLYSGALSITPAAASPIRIPVTLQVFNPAALPASFSDVPASHPFADYVFLLKTFGVTNGCTSTTYCPDSTVTRGQMAAFLIRARYGESFSFDAGQAFADVPETHPFFNYIQKLRETGITLGCSATTFCPDSSVTRGQMAAFLIRALVGENFTYSTVRSFDDVPTTFPLFKYIQKLKELGVTRGCSTTQYCPDSPVTRGEMAAFLGRAFFGYGLPSSATPPPNPQCTVFPSDHIWNTPVDTLEVHSRSAAWVNTIGASRGFHADFGSGLWEGAPIGIPFIQTTSSAAPVAVSFEYSDESDPGPYPIPPNPPIEGGSQSSGDRHVLVLDQAACKLYELYAAYPNSDGSWRAGSGAIYDLRGYALRPDGWTSADAAGLPILPGLVRYDEVAAGEIRHAIRFTVPQSQRAYLWPARHYASNLTGTQYPPMGARFRLKAGYDISSYPASVQVILQAMKKYGIINADNGSAWYISGAPDERWKNDELSQFSRLKGSDFEAVDAAPLMIDSNSGRARQP
jgi:hypothetical protein